MDWEELRARLASRLGGGWSLEPATVLAAVAAHRDYWKPHEVRVLLLAESHVLTHGRELAATVDLAPCGHAGAPSEFVRLVYCLGYGEKALVPRVSPNQGSPQFWKLFAACVGDLQGERVLKGFESNTERRVQNKVALLEELKARGVWLLDASPVALYRSGGGKPKATEVSSALEAAWSVYASGIVQALQPRVVMVIGKMVHDALEERVRQIVRTQDALQWMYQPQAHVSAAEHADGLKRLWRMVEAHGKQ